MSDASTQFPREKRAAIFIVTAMVLALFWMLMRLDFGGTEHSVPERRSIAGKAAHRIALQLAPDALRRLGADSVAATLRDAGITWVVVPVPLWSASGRRAEFSTLEWEALAEDARLMTRAGLRVLLAPLYTEATGLRPRPAHNISGAFLSSYRDLVEECAALAARAEATGLLLDGVFGEQRVSASEWLDLIARVRGEYDGLLEMRIGKKATPALYTVHANGAHVDETAVMPKASSATPLHIVMDDRDIWTSSQVPWSGGELRAAPALRRAEQLLERAAGDSSVHGVTLTGAELLDILRAGDGRSRSLRSRIAALQTQWMTLDLHRPPTELRQDMRATPAESGE